MQTKLKSRKWKSLVSGILLAASASSFLIAPVFAAEYTDPLTGIVKDDKAIIGADGNTVKLNKSTLLPTILKVRTTRLRLKILMVLPLTQMVAITNMSLIT